MNKLYRNRRFWIVIVIISLMSSLYICFFFESEYDLIDERKLRYVCFDDYRTESLLTLRSIDNEKEIVSYLKYVKDSGKFNFNSGAVWNDQKVYFVKSHGEYDLSEIVVSRENPSVGKSGIERFWIWNDYISKSPCDSTLVPKALSRGKVTN